MTYDKSRDQKDAWLEAQDSVIANAPFFAAATEMLIPTLNSLST